MVDYNLIMAFAFVLAFFSALIYLGLPEELWLLNDTDLTLFATEIITVAGTCVISTGLPCAGVMIFWGIANIYTFLIVNTELIKILIITPILITVLFVIAKLARGS